MDETEHFVKEPFGWVCRRCRDERASEPASDERSERALPQEGRARFFHEGEAGDRASRLSAPALARWRDRPVGRVLFCPHCGAEEPV